MTVLINQLGPSVSYLVADSHCWMNVMLTSLTDCQGNSIGDRKMVDDEDDDDRATSFAQRHNKGKKKKLTSHCCCKPGHSAPECSDRTRVEPDDWHVRTGVHPRNIQVFQDNSNDNDDEGRVGTASASGSSNSRGN